MKTVIIIWMLVLLASIAYAKVYKWEDENGMHFTDSPASVPEKYRENVYAETRAQINSTTPQARADISQQNMPIATQIHQSAVYQANLEQQKRAAEAIRQQQARALVVSTKKVESVFAFLAGFMIIWIMIGLFIFIAWISTIVDIVRSEFETPSNKTVWMLLVIFLPMIGMILYYIFGLNQKCRSMKYNHLQNDELHARLISRDPKDRDFII